MNSTTETSVSSLFGVYLGIVSAIYLIPLFLGDMPAQFLSASTSLAIVAVPLFYSMARRRSFFAWGKNGVCKSAPGFAAGICILLFIAMFASTLGLSLLLAPVHRLFPGISSGAMPRYEGFAVKFVLTALLPAICEELTFRGFFYFSLRRTMSNRKALILSSLLFAVLHPIPASLPGVFVAGLALGAAAGLTGSVVPSILMHVLHNSLLLAIVPVWSAMDPGVVEMLILLGAGFACCVIAWFAVKNRFIRTASPS